MWYNIKVIYMKTKKRTKKRKNLFYKTISIILAVVSVIFLGILSYIDLLPSKYLTILVIIILLFDLLNITLLNIKRLKRKIKKGISVIVVFAILIMLIGNFYLSKTLGVLMSNGDSKYKLENYSVIVLKNSNYNNIEDIRNKTVGYYQNSTGSKEAQEYLGKKVNIDFKSYSSSDTLVADLLNSKIDVILIEDAIINIMGEELDIFNSSIKVIYTFTVKVKVELTLKDVDVTKDSFIIYISGIDTYGKISSVSRSDVNIVMVVNPTTKQVLLISIPRDYYVQLHGTTGTKDKLTHAGIYGIDMSIKTIEDLLDIDINYYLKVNFTSVIDIVDALGGVDVYSEYTFISYSGYSFKEGYNKANGEQALDFARTRKAFADGDRQRGKNQQALIEAIIRKSTSKSIITKYSSLLDAVNGKYQTNMSIKKITSLIKKQLNDMSSWNITSYSLTGSDSYNNTYTYNQLLYVMEPNKESIEEAKELISRVLGNESLDSSYGEMTGNSHNVNKVDPPAVEQPEIPSTEDPDDGLEGNLGNNEDNINAGYPEENNESAGSEKDPDESDSPEDENNEDSSDGNEDGSIDEPIEDITPKPTE